MQFSRRTPRVCFVNLRAYHLFARTGHPVGGSEVKIFEISTHLAKSSRVSLITGDFGQEQMEKHKEVAVISSCDMAHPYSIKNIFRLWGAQWRASADIYVTTVFGKEIFPLWLFCKVFKKKFIYITASDNECNGKQSSLAGLWGKLFTIALEHCDAIVTITQSHKELLKEYHPLINCPILHIPIGITIPPLISTEKKYITWIARCDPIKNPHLFIELALQFPNEKFLMVAAPIEGSVDFFKKIQQQALQVKNITFIPGVSSEQAQNLFYKSKLAVNTSDFEGFSIAFIQSGIAATPIASLSSNPDSIITKCNLGIDARGDFNSLVTQMRELLTDPRLLQEKSNNSRTYTENHHNIHQTITSWEGLVAQSDLL